MLDYLYNAGYMKTFNELRSEAPEVVCMIYLSASVKVIKCYVVPFDRPTSCLILRHQRAGY
jgi:hypothetical protein